MLLPAEMAVGRRQYFLGHDTKTKSRISKNRFSGRGFRLFPKSDEKKSGTLENAEYAACQRVFRRAYALLRSRGEFRIVERVSDIRYVTTNAP